MNYKIHLIYLNKGTEILNRQQLKVSSDSPLTSLDIMQRCENVLEFDSQKYERVGAELWTKERNSKEYSKLADSLELTESIHAALEYYVELDKK